MFLLGISKSFCFMQLPTGLHPQAVQEGRDAVKRAGGVSSIAGAAAVGGVVAGVALGPTAAVLAAGGAAYAATRSDGVGEAARQVGAAAVTAGQQAKAYDQEHNVTGKVVRTPVPMLQIFSGSPPVRRASRGAASQGEEVAPG